MESLKNWWYGTALDASKSTTKMNAVNNQVPEQKNRELSPEELLIKAQNEQQKMQAQMQERQAALMTAAEKVNDAKNMYDLCEQRRMTAVSSGKDSQDYSCEREFAAFKKAFDQQLVLESKVGLS